LEDAVIALCVHNAEGAMGVGVGHELEGITLHMLFKDLDLPTDCAPDLPIHYGGPVEPQRGFVIHTPDYTGPARWPPGRLVRHGQPRHSGRHQRGGGPEKWLIALGYAGWTAGQLDTEMRSHGWFAADSHPDILFSTPVDERWHAAWEAEGIDPAHLVNVTGRA
jgi:putative transcriptional regulator